MRNRLDVFLSTLNLVFVLIGYQFVTIIFSGYMNMDDEGMSQIVTIPYRALSVFIPVLIIFRNLKEKYKMGTIVKVLWFYWRLLLLRFFVDFFVKDNTQVLPSTVMKSFLFMGPMTLVPMFAVQKSVRFINMDKLFKWTYYIASISVIIIFIKQNLGFGGGTYERMQASVALGSLGTGQLGLIALIMSFSVLYNEKYSNRFEKLFAIFILVVGLIIMFRSGSRGPLFVLICLFAMYLFGRIKSKFAALLLVTIVAFLGYWLYEYILDILGYFSPMLSARIIAAAGNQLETRSEFYEEAIRLFIENPFTGGAFAHYNDGGMMYTHNAFLDSLMQLGVIGLILIYIYLKPISSTIQFFKTNDNRLWLGLFLSQSLISTMLSSSFYNSYEISILIVLLYTLPIARNVNRQKHKIGSYNI